MENLNRNLCGGRQLLVPFTSPIMFNNNFKYNNIPNPVRSLEHFSKPVQEGQQKSHRRTSSDTSFHLEENPSWLEDLLDEPAELPIRKGHRRSLSYTPASIDETAYKEQAKGAHNNMSIDNSSSVPCWSSINYDQNNEEFEFSGGNLIPKNPKSNADHNKNSMMSDSSSGFPNLQASGELLGSTTQKADQMVKPDETPSSKAFSKSDSPQPTPLNPDAKRAKQQANHRSRVRKLQYIAELERCVQILQIQGLGVSAELEFLDQQNLILGMENRVLKHRLDSISQEQLLKCLEQDMLEREIARLRNLHQQQQLQQQQLTRRLPKNRELDCQFAGMSINHNGIGSLQSN